MQGLLESALSSMRKIKNHFALIYGAVVIFRGILLAIFLSLFLVRLQPMTVTVAFGCGLFILALHFFISIRFVLKRFIIHGKIFLLAAEMNFPQNRTSAFVLRRDNQEKVLNESLEAQTEWSQSFQVFKGDLIKQEKERLTGVLGQSLMVAVMLMFSFLMAPEEVKEHSKRFWYFVSNELSEKATLKILEGATTEDQATTFVLKKNKVLEIELLRQNLIEVQISGVKALPNMSSPFVELRREELPKAGVFQSFQMSRQRNSKILDGEDRADFSVAFSAQETVLLFLGWPEGEGRGFNGVPLAKIKVKELPVPKVELSVVSKLEDPWPDDKPLTLSISVKAKNPLQLIKLLIITGQRRAEELVNRIMSEDMTTFSTEYSLVLEPYMESDFSDVTIVAEAIDRAHPVPLVGVSEPLKLKAASAYGRYRRTLETLGDLKGILDLVLQKNEKKLPSEALKQSKSAVAQAERSPFFDGLDRSHIDKFDIRVSELSAKFDMNGVQELTTELGSFLFEHELLDDRERDRDFFIAARSLSHLLEQDNKDKERRKSEVLAVTERIKQFLDDRLTRWNVRVNRLPEKFKPERWPKISDKYFQKFIQRIEKNERENLNEAKRKAMSLNELSRAVAEYRTWIEELEAKEDAFRAEQEQARQQGLSSAREKLQELQKRQDLISSDLDHATERGKSDLEKNWPSDRMQQNTNIKESEKLSDMLRMMAPMAGVRIDAAIESMKVTVESGNEGQFPVAESGSDNAARLLRLAKESTREQQSGSRGRRRRIAGNNYYGQTIVGGDIEIKREYEVDKRYREEILDEVRHSSAEGEDRNLLEDYLRQVIR